METLIISFALLIGSIFAPAQTTPEQITINNGQSKAAQASGICVKFVELIEDSRCPTDVNCIWAGVARIRVKLSKNGKSEEFELNTNQRDKPAIFEGYSVALTSLAPHPTTTSKYSPSAYSATFTVSKIKE
ncbi:MAG: hypothetical protein AB7F88_08360 [Pyrinomonadaceae bacterium]